MEAALRPKPAAREILSASAPPLVTGSLSRSQPAVDPAEDDTASASLRGSLSEWTLATAVNIGTSVGYTTNAGPVLGGVASVVRTIDAETQQAIARTGEKLTLQAMFSKREYEYRNDVSEQDYRAKTKYALTTRDGAELGMSASLAKHIDVDENVAELGMSLAYQWPKGRWLTPFVEVSGAYLDYDSIEGDIFEFGNQDDRDRLSVAVQSGLVYQLSAPLSIKLGAGVDAKRYIQARDDFGLARNNLSVFPFLGVAYLSERLTAELLYAPVYRTYSEEAFRPLLAHTLAAKAEIQMSSALKLFARAKAGLEETDFLSAKTIGEYVLSGGGVITTSGGTAAGLEVTYTLSDFAGYARVDHKLEATVRAKTPVGGNLFLTGEARYTAFETSFAGGAKTDMLMATVGLSYQLAE